MNNHRQRKEMKEDTLKKVSNDAKRKVLVVEDNQLNREMLAEYKDIYLGDDGEKRMEYSRDGYTVRYELSHFSINTLR